MFRICIVVLLLAPTLAAQINPSGIIRGAVTDDHGGAMSGVLVTAQRDGVPVFGRTTTSAAGGAFALEGLPAGSYSLCAQVPAGGYLDPCQWSLQVPTVTLANRQVSTGNTVQVRRGGTVRIHMLDTGNQLSQRTRDGRPPHLLLGVPTPRGPLATARAATRGNGSTDFELTVPLGMRLNLLVSSRDLQLGDSLGAPLAGNNSRDPFQNDSDSAPRVFNYAVLGLLP